MAAVKGFNGLIGQPYVHRRQLDYEMRTQLSCRATARMGKPFRAAAAALAPLNELLARDNSFQKVEAAGRHAEDGRCLQLRTSHRWENPVELLDPIARAAADLIAIRISD